jgi:hypothetical protein
MRAWRSRVRSVRRRAAVSDGACPRAQGPDGRPEFYRDVAVLAVPEARILEGFEFVIELPPPGPHSIERVVLYNTESDEPERYGPQHLFAKDFSVAVSTRGPWADAFREVVRGTLQPHADAQAFAVRTRAGPVSAVDDP